MGNEIGTYFLVLLDSLEDVGRKELFAVLGSLIVIQLLCQKIIPELLHNLEGTQPSQGQQRLVHDLGKL